jgi:tetratricopeptide (TPR) repeat protein
MIQRKQTFDLFKTGTILSVALLISVFGVSCKTISDRHKKTGESSEFQNSLRDTSPQKNSADWERLIEQFSRGPLSGSEADLAFLMAENFINQKQLEPATKLMRAVFNSQPSMVSGLELIRLVSLGGDLTEGEQIARKLQVLYAKSPEPSLAMAYIAQLKGNRDEALNILDSTARRHPKNEEVSARYITLLMESGKKAKAKEVLLKAISAMPQSPYFLLRLARIRAEEKNYKEAKNLLDKLLRFAPDHIEGWTLAGFIAVQENNGAAAERYFREAYERQPENDTLARYYVTQLLRLNKYQEARRLLIRLEATTDGDEQLDPDLIFQLGYVLFQLDDYTEAKKRFISLIDKAHDKNRMYFYAAQCEDQLKNSSAALELYKKIETTSELSKVARQRIIQLTIDSGKFEDATILLSEFARLAEEKPMEDDYKFIAGSFSKMANFSKAQSFSELGLQRFPDSVDLQYLKAAYIEHTISRQASISALEKLITKHPDHIQSLNHLGYTLGEANQKLEFALSLIQRAVQKEPKNGFYLDSLGWLHFKLKHYAEAEKALKAALALEPAEPVIHEHLGELKFVLGDYSAALKSFETASHLFEKQPKWKIESDMEWSASRIRVDRRIQEIRQRALPRNDS